MRILFIGDVIGRPGRDVLAAELPNLRKSLNAFLKNVGTRISKSRAGQTKTFGETPNRHREGRETCEIRRGKEVAENLSEQARAGETRLSFENAKMTEKPKSARVVVGVMNYPRLKGRVEVDQTTKEFFGICERCAFATNSASSFDEAFHMLIEHRRTCSQSANTQERKIKSEIQQS